MISCTEFIPSYSELFTFLEKNYGRDEVDRFWEYLFEPTGEGIPLINFLKKEGIKGCFTYWGGTLNEEAADFTMYLNEKDGWFKIDMHHCPSKGRLLELKDEIGIEPYHDYCLHCDHYRESVEKIGLKSLYDFSNTYKASCSELIYDPKIFKNKLIVDENTLIMQRNASDNEYFHMDFHSSLNNGIEYLGSKYGEDVLTDYLTIYTENVYKKVIEDIKARGIDAIADKIADTYKTEKSEDVLTLTKNGDELIVEIEYCPAVKHLRDTGRSVTKWFSYSTSVVMATLAKYANKTFTMEFYDDETGKAKYSFK